MSHDEQFGTMWSSIDFDYGKLRRLPSACGFLKINLKFVAVFKKLVLGSVRGMDRMGADIESIRLGGKGGGGW
jgi:hypothetical protein